MNIAIKKGVKVGSAVRDLGCSVQELKMYLEGLFRAGMTWETWGRGAGKWHIDHVKPLASFDLSDPAQAAAAVHFSNLQPLWEKENLAKGSRVA